MESGILNPSFGRIAVDYTRLNAKIRALSAIDALQPEHYETGGKLSKEL